MENIFLLKWRMEMTKILIFPFLSISTGHHHVADSLQAELLLKSHQCEKIDIFHMLIGGLKKPPLRRICHGFSIFRKSTARSIISWRAGAIKRRSATSCMR